jgi:hypothetical protein
MSETVVRSWNELQDALFAGAWMPDLRRYRSQYAFRGGSDAGAPLATTLARLGGDYPELEHHLLRNFRKYAVRAVVERDTVWHWLTMAQHHGLPTRLLDWTFSPYVALHFATADTERHDVDGVVWAVNFATARRLLPPPLRERLEREGADVFTVEMLADAVGTLGELERLAADPFVLFFEPPSIDDRIVNQAALFSTMSSARGSFDDWRRANPVAWRKTVIPARLKGEVRDKLDQSNVTERVLFPGLDGLSRWLRRHYSPIASAPPPES